MGLLKSFKAFAKRVLSSVKGNLSRSDRKLLEHLLTRTNERNLVLARGLLTALSMNSKKAKKEDIKKLAKIFDNVNFRMMSDAKKDPFTKNEQKTISQIFRSHGLSQKVADWVSSQRDIFLYNQISEISQKSLNPKTKTKIVKIKKKNKRKIT